MTREFEFNADFDRQVDEMVEHRIIRPWAGDVRDDAERFAPRDTGALAGSVEVVVVSSHEALVGSDLDYAASVEMGSRPHVIRVKNAKVLRNPRTGQVFGTKVNHPGTPAQPWLRPALYKERHL